MFVFLEFICGLFYNYCNAQFEGGVTSGIGAMFGNPDVLLYAGIARNAMTTCHTLFRWAVILCAVIYLGLLLYRWHNFERDVITSDFAAIMLRKRILRTLNIPAKIREFRRTANYNQGSSGAKSTLVGGMKESDRAKLNALLALKRMRVYVNTRQSLDDETVERRYRVVIETPFIQDEYEQMQSLLKNFDTVATRMERGKVSFGSQVVSADQSQVEYMDSLVVPDKFAFEVVTDSGVVSTGTYESTFPLSLFVDRQAEIDKKAGQAKRWGFQTAAQVDDLLATMEAGAKRAKVNVGASNVQFDYTIAFRLKEDVVSKLGETLDKRFNTSGSTAELHGNKISLVISLPDNIKKPINVPTLYREAFG